MDDEMEIEGPSKHPQLSSERAGITFPVDVVAKSLKDTALNRKIGYAAPVYLAAVLEYISAEVLELAGREAIKDKMTRIVPRHVQCTLWNDSELLRTLFMCSKPSEVYMSTLLNYNKDSSSSSHMQDEEDME